MITAAVLMAVMTLSSCGNKSKNNAPSTPEEQAFALTQDMLKAAKSNDIEAFKTAMEAQEALELTEEQSAALDSLVNARISEDELMTLAFYMLGHLEELTGESLDWGEESDDDPEYYEGEEFDEAEVFDMEDEASDLDEE